MRGCGKRDRGAVYHRPQRKRVYSGETKETAKGLPSWQLMRRVGRSTPDSHNLKALLTMYFYGSLLKSVRFFSCSHPISFLSFFFSLFDKPHTLASVFLLYLF